MRTSCPSVLVSRRVGIGPDILQQLPMAERADLSGPAGEGEPCVLLLTPSEALALCEQPSGTAVWLVWLTEGEILPAALAGHPRVAAVLDHHCRAETVVAAVHTAQAMLAGLAGAARSAQRLERVLEVGRALAAEKDLDTLLSLILDNARALTVADGASIYTRERDGRLYFRLWQNRSVPNTAGVERKPVGEESMAGYVARTGKVVALDDAYDLPADVPYHFNPVFDQATGYRTRSLLTLPLTNKGGEVVGVLQLINRKDDEQTVLDAHEAVARHVHPFDEQDRAIALALAGQAGVALENSLLYADIERLFEGFIRASVAAIEARDPTTAGHSFRVAGFTERLAQAVDRSDVPDLRALRFTREELREIRYAALLHDFGKVGVREDVLVKAKKLHPHQLEQLKQRFKYARLRVSWQAYQQLFALIESEELDPDRLRGERRAIELQIAGEHQKLDRYLHTILRANEPTILHANAPDELREILGYAFPDDDGYLPLLQEFEFSGLSLPKGSLSDEERVEIESHVSHTYSFLSLIPWTRDLSRLPEFAYAHHEKLDGTGYPRGLRHQDIPVQARMMTISDIYDALTAPDRPYKLAVPVERALAILESEARANKVDGVLLRAFIESGAYRDAS